MKKTISIALFAVAFGLVGCAHKPDVNANKDNVVSTANQKPKCKHCHHKGKLGVEKTEEDVAK